MGTNPVGTAPFTAPEQQLGPDARDSPIDSSFHDSRSLRPLQPVATNTGCTGRCDGTTSARRGGSRAGPWTSVLLLTATPSATTDARHWTAAQLERRGFQSVDVREDAELVVSELVSNAVLHGRAPITVTLVDAPGDLTVSVTDCGGPPHLVESRPADPTAAHGRGLSIVASLALSWGVRAQRPGPGKTVWSRLGVVPDDA